MQLRNYLFKETYYLWFRNQFFTHEISWKRLCSVGLENELSELKFINLDLPWKSRGYRITKIKWILLRQLFCKNES